MSKIEDLSERVERLLLRHAELHRTNALLEQQLLATAQERDLLRVRLQAARTRLDALIERLPPEPGEPGDPGDPTEAAALAVSTGGASGAGTVGAVAALPASAVESPPAATRGGA